MQRRITTRYGLDLLKMVDNNLITNLSIFSNGVKMFCNFRGKMKEQSLTIPIDKIKSDFQLFLTPEHNRRIIFSGPFGIGKTYFLNEFFREETEYFPIFLRPVNYSLLTNEDIFKLIKYDILAELIKEKEFNIDDEFDFSKAEYLKFFLNENKFLILRNLLKAIPKIRNIVSVADDFGKLISKYKEGLDKINSDPSLEMLKQFQQDSENNFLLEYDEVSEYISSMLEEIAEAKKQREEKPKKVLIIDDLDRLDPEHIFRLFNVFSAHFDQVHYYENIEGNDNKFGFDKIIFVCDIENIRKIFAHKYGAEVDFSGYIDKFYSTEIYEFLHSLNFRDEIYPFFESIFKKRFNDNHQSMFFNATKLLFQILFENQEISIRDMERLGKLGANAYKVDKIKVPFTNCFAPQDSFISIYGVLISLRLFKILFESEQELFKRLNRALKKNKLTKDGGYFQYEVETIIPQLILFSEIETHKFSSNTEKFVYKLGNGQSIEYKINTEALSNRIIETGPYRYYVNLNGKANKLASVFQYLLKRSIENISKYGLLN